MGVPSFFRWLAEKYPGILKAAVERLPVTQEDGRVVYEDSSLPNPNEIEYDNLYDLFCIHDSLIFAVSCAVIVLIVFITTRPFCVFCFFFITDFFQIS